MKIETLNADIKLLESALKYIEKTENYMHFKKSALMFDLCEQINVLREKRDKQIDFLKKLQNSIYK